MRRLRTQVIVNPESNQGRTRRRWKQIREAIRSFIHDFRYDFTEKLQAIEITREAIKSGHELIIGVGGDGTMNEIANGFFEGRRMINPGTALGIVPSGTGSDLTRSLYIPPRLRDALKIITQAPSTPIDVGRVTFRANSGSEMERFFLNVADFGVGGEVVRRVNQRRLERKTSSYIRCLVSTMRRYQSKRVKLRVDGREVAEEEFVIGAVANGRIFGKGMKFAPHAKLDDGQFDIILVRDMGFFEFCRHGWRVFLGTHLSHPKISFLRGREVESLSPDRSHVLLELDGEQLGGLPARFEIRPRHLLVKGYI